MNEMLSLDHPVGVVLFVTILIIGLGLLIFTLMYVSEVKYNEQLESVMDLSCYELKDKIANLEFTGRQKYIAEHNYEWRCEK